MPGQANIPRRTTRITRSDANPAKRSRRLTLHLRKKKVSFAVETTKKRKVKTVEVSENEKGTKGKTNVN